jgi:hypothetical protein
MLGTTPIFTLAQAPSPLLRVAPDLVFVLSLLAVGVLCAAAAVGVALLIDRMQSRAKSAVLSPSRRRVPGIAVGALGIVLGVFAWSMMTLVPNAREVLGSSGWGIVAASGLFGFAALARGLLRAKHPRTQRPHTELATPLPQRTAA